MFDWGLPLFGQACRKWTRSAAWRKWVDWTIGGFYLGVYWFDWGLTGVDWGLGWFGQACRRGTYSAAWQRCVDLIFGSVLGSEFDQG